MSSLGDTERGILENVIDNCITWIPEWVPEYRKEEAKKMWMYEKAEDFLLGLTIGMIFSTFEGFFLTMHKRQLDPEERTNVMTIIFKRMPQIREALFSSG
jgi:hypothetical protein